MDDNFHSEINMEEIQHPHKSQQEDYQVFFSTIQINEFDKKMNHNNILEFPMEFNENSFPTYSKLGNSNAKIDSIDYFDNNNNNNNNKLNSNKIQNFKPNNTLNFNYPELSKNSESLFSYNNEDDVAKFNETARQENFEIFQHVGEQEMKNYLVENHNDNLLNNNKNNLESGEWENPNKKKSNKRIEIEPLRECSADDLSNYIIKEKEEKKDLIGSHKIYEIFFQNANNELSLKCYRRYDNFFKFFTKISDEFPFALIPRLPVKNPLAKFIKIQQEFYESRKNQLNFFINFIKKNDHISQSLDFKKFISNADFDEDHFSVFSNKLRRFPFSLNVSETLKNKIFGVFSNLFGNRESRRIQSNEERFIRKLEIHYKTVCEKYLEVKENMVIYLKSISKCAIGYKYISNTLLYIRDNLSNPDSNSEIFNSYSILSNEFSEINKENYDKIGKNLEHKFENFLNVLQGLTDLFDRYNNFMSTFDSVTWAKSYSFDNNLRETEEISREYNEALSIKETFEKNIIEEVNHFDKHYSNNYNQIISEFVEFIKKINNEEFESVKQTREINASK